MSVVLNLPVYIIFAYILYQICKSDDAGKFYALALGSLLFPAVGTIISSPALTPNQAFLYTYFLVEILHSIGKNHKTYKRILYLPLLLIIGSISVTILYTEGLNVKTFYIAGRDFCETYGYLIAAFIAGTRIPGHGIYRTFYTPVLILCCFAVIEVLIEYNIPYTFICSAYPNTDMAYTSLARGGTFSDSWRIRASVTTAHPTALGTLLSCLFAFYLPLWKKEIIEQKKLVVLLLALLVATVVCGSRTAMVCAALTIALFLFSRVNIYLKIFIAGMVVFSFGAALSFFVSQFEDSRGSNLNFRREQLLFSVLAIQQSPIYGNGVQYISKYIFGDTDDGSRGLAKGYDNENLGGLESIIFRKLIDYGFLGLGCFFAFLAFFQFYFLINRKKSIYALSGAFTTLSFTLFLILSGTLQNSIIYGYVFLGYCLGKVRTLNVLGIDESEDAEEQESLEESEAEIEEAQEVKAITAKN